MSPETNKSASEKLAGAIIIGGGFYGINIALYLAEVKKIENVILIESSNKLMSKASSNNQARVHNGYHYPRSLTTAFRSRINMDRFLEDWSDAVCKDFTNIYAIAKNNSKVSAKQFCRFCNEIGAKLEEADETLNNLFDKRLVDSVFLVEEFVFDWVKISTISKKRLKLAGVSIHYNTTAKQIKKNLDGRVEVLGQRDGERNISFNSNLVINCTYSGLNQFGGDYHKSQLGLKHELTEMAMIKLPQNLKNYGITLMDGPFFSILPFPSREGIHSLSHVRYTPHLSWNDSGDINPYKKLSNYEKNSQFERMKRDACRYIPALQDIEYVDSVFEVKSVLEKNEVDDGRPIFYERNESIPGLISVFGGKIDNVYDVLERLSHEV